MWRTVKRVVPIRTKEMAKGVIKEVRRRWRLPSAAERPLPDIFIAGTQKGGTTTLHSYLSRHPQVVSGLGKEIYFFDTAFHRGSDWYRAHFPRLADDLPAGVSALDRHAIDATPRYMFYPGAMERLAAAVPGARIILMLRNPADRAYSAYHHQVRKGRETLSFEAAIEAEDARLAGETERLAADARYFAYSLCHFSYLARGRYREQVERCYCLFPREQVHIIQSERFFAESRKVYDEVLAFLGLSPHRLTAYENVNRKPYTPAAPAVRRRLLAYFDPYNDALFELLGTRYDWQ